MIKDEKYVFAFLVITVISGLIYLSSIIISSDQSEDEDLAEIYTQESVKDTCRTEHVHPYGGGYRMNGGKRIPLPPKPVPLHVPSIPKHPISSLYDKNIPSLLHKKMVINPGDFHSVRYRDLEYRIILDALSRQDTTGIVEHPDVDDEMLDTQPIDNGTEAVDTLKNN